MAANRLSLMSESLNYDVIIAGGGPAGASAAIHLANSGALSWRCVKTSESHLPSMTWLAPHCSASFIFRGFSVG